MSSVEYMFDCKVLTREDWSPSLTSSSYAAISRTKKEVLLRLVHLKATGCWDDDGRNTITYHQGDVIGNDEGNMDLDYILEPSKRQDRAAYLDTMLAFMAVSAHDRPSVIDKLFFAFEQSDGTPLDCVITQVYVSGDKPPKLVVDFNCLENVELDDNEDSIRRQEAACSICYQQFTTTATRLPCSHLYHENCIRKWIDISLSCPMCRYKLPTKKDEEGKEEEEEEEDIASEGEDAEEEEEPGWPMLFTVSAGFILTTFLVCKLVRGST